jgi:tetratricopeptide (TPR) repeat protein
MIIEGKVQRLIYKAVAEKDPKKKIAIYQEAKTIDPKHKVVRNNLGWAYFLNKEPDEAKQELEQALKIDPDYALAYSNLGQVYHNEDSYKAALNYLWAIENDPSFEKPQEKLVELLKEADDGFKFEVCELASGMGDVENIAPAVIVYNLMIQADPENAQPYANLGKFYRDSFEKEQAIKYFRKAVELNPNHKFAKEQLEKLTGEK